MPIVKSYIRNNKIAKIIKHNFFTTDSFMPIGIGYRAWPPATIYKSDSVKTHEII